MSIDFYKNIQPVDSFRLIAKQTSYHPVPADWWLVITDVVSSTQAIQNGRYKDVNTAGAISIVALSNRNILNFIPLIFGGDGITLLTPPDLLTDIKDIFYGTSNFVKENFDLDLRVGYISMKEIRESGNEISVGKYSSHDPFSQAILNGDGLDFGEAQIKSGNKYFLIPTDYKPKIFPDYSGFSCPFLDVKSESGVVMALILRSKIGLTHYDLLLGELLTLLGSEKEHYPVSWRNLNLIRNAEDIRTWATVSAGNRSGFSYYCQVKLISFLMTFLSMINKKIRIVAQSNIPLFTDHKKFDGSLKMVITCSDATKQKLMNWLNELEKSGDAIYGLHESDSTRITCVLAGKGGDKEHHLIDGSNGGYALAAKMLKAKI